MLAFEGSPGNCVLFVFVLDDRAAGGFSYQRPHGLKSKAKSVNKSGIKYSTLAQHSFSVTS